MKTLIEDEWKLESNGCGEYIFTSYHSPIIESGEYTIQFSIDSSKDIYIPVTVLIRGKADENLMIMIPPFTKLYRLINKMKQKIKDNTDKERNIIINKAIENINI
jgi:hypothetical protein